MSAGSCCKQTWDGKAVEGFLPQMQDSPPLPQQVVGFATEAIVMWRGAEWLG